MSIHPIRSKAGETEKVTINLGFVDLGQIDLLVQEGFYSNRTDFIRTAIRNQLSTHAEVVNKSVVRRTLELGLQRSQHLCVLRTLGTHCLSLSLDLFPDLSDLLRFACVVLVS